MQFSVPQYTDVEDRLVANLTIKQFGVLFAAGLIVFLGYSSTKSVLVAMFLAFLFGVPALVITFGKVNGRPIYATFPLIIKFFTNSKELIFKKEAITVKQVTGVKKLSQPTPEPKVDSTSGRGRLFELQRRLDESASEKEKLFTNK